MCKTKSRKQWCCGSRRHRHRHRSGDEVWFEPWALARCSSFPVVSTITQETPAKSPGTVTARLTLSHQNVLFVPRLCCMNLAAQPLTCDSISAHHLDDGRVLFWFLSPLSASKELRHPSGWDYREMMAHWCFPCCISATCWSVEQCEPRENR